MNVCFLYSGQLRHPEVALPTHLWHLIAPAHAAGHDVRLIWHATTEQEATALDSAKRMLVPVTLFVEDEPTLDEKDYARHLGEGARNVQGCLRQLWALKQLWVAHWGVKFDADLVFRVRYDLEFTSAPLDWTAPLPIDRITLPMFGGFGVTPLGGYNDAFAYGPSGLMAAYFRRCDRLDEYMALGHPFHMETFLRWVLDDVKAPIGRCDVRFNKVYADGSRGAPEFQARYGDIMPSNSSP